MDKTDIPEEDKLLCKHTWCILFDVGGPDRNTPDLYHQSFFCEKCLEIRHKTFSQGRIKLRREFLEEYEDGLTGATDG